MDVGLSVSARLGEVETVEYQRDRGMGVTVFFGTRKGTASTGDLSPVALRETVGKACTIAKFTAEDPCAGLPDAEDLATGIPDLDLSHPWDVTPEQACEMAIECEAAAMAVDPAHHEFRRRRCQHASRHSRVRQLAWLPGGVSRHRAQHQLFGARLQRRADGARLLVQHRRATGANSRMRSASVVTAVNAPCAGSARASSPR